MEVEQTQPEQTAEQRDGIWQPTDSPAESVSLSEHEETFSKEGRGLPAGDEEVAPEGETAEQKAERLHHSAEQRREKETGKFAEGKKRTPRNDPQARIDAIAGKLMAAEQKAAAAEAELAELKARNAPKAEIAKAEQKVEAAAEKVSGFSEPEPTEDDPKFGGDYGKYLRAVSAWEGRKAYHDARMAEREEAQKAQREQQDHAKLKTFAERVTASKEKYEDFEAVAFGPTQIREGSPIDAFIMEDEQGPDVLYHLNKHPEDLTRISAMSEIKQLKELTLLSQKFSQGTPGAAETTGSAPERKVVVMPPKPPNPVRTEAQRTSDGPPTDRELSLSEHEKYFGRRRR